MLVRYIKFCIVIFCLLSSIGLFFNQAFGQTIPSPATTSLRGKPFNNITLEASLKPFKKKDKAYIRQVAIEIFTQWQSLLRHADTVSVMLWTADGSEILDYRGTLTQKLEWAKYMGNPNTEHEVGSLPKELSIHERAYLYMDAPPDFDVCRSEVYYYNTERDRAGDDWQAHQDRCNLRSRPRICQIRFQV